GLVDADCEAEDPVGAATRRVGPALARDHMRDAVRDTLLLRVGHCAGNPVRAMRGIDALADDERGHVRAVIAVRLRDARRAATRLIRVGTWQVLPADAVQVRVA